MIHFYKVLTSLFLSGITFAVTHKQAGDIYLAGPIAGVVLLVSFILLYGESNLFPKLKADVLFLRWIRCAFGACNRLVCGRSRSF